MRRALPALALPVALMVLSGCPLDVLTLPGGSTGTSGSECVSSADCADANPCTIETCEGGFCSAKAAPKGAVCGAGASDLCSGTESCDGKGACVSSEPLELDDGDSCTTDSCEPKTGAISHDEAPNCVSWTATPEASAPSARERHTAIWTGSRMIVWGGSVEGMTPVTATGGVFDPIARVWTPTSMTGAPSPRHSHSAAWTGSKMIIWGGFGISSFETSGALYDPATDTWAPMTSAGAPPGRTQHCDVWTGTELLVWGGYASNTLATGGRYNPVTNTWAQIPAPAGFSPRFGHSAVWTGDRMLTWAGQNGFDWLLDGAYYNPAAGAWAGVTSTMGAPAAREGHTAIWTGSAMVVWGGWNGGPVLNSGGSFDPAMGAKGTWTATSNAGAPSHRDEHTATWTGSKMLIWGGCGGESCKDIYGDGALWTPGGGGGTWAPVAPHPELSARRGHTAVWTGSEVIVWGGRTGSKPTSTGAQAPLD